MMWVLIWIASRSKLQEGMVYEYYFKMYILNIHK